MIRHLNDIELVQLAAKAIGITLHIWGTPGAENIADVTVLKKPRPWNPLHDDGDALRLLVTLGDTGALRHRVAALSIGCGRTACEFNYVSHGQDAAAATRRAIVIAAAIIGAGLQ